jgi:hypothetical protein
LLANRDNSYTIIPSPHYRRTTGVFTSHERRVINEIFTPSNLPTYQADGMGSLERAFRLPDVVRLGLWVCPGHRSGNACWGETNLSPATQHLIATFDRFLAAKVDLANGFPARSVLSN